MSTQKDNEVLLDDDGLPKVSLIPRNGQLIVTPKTVKPTRIELPNGQMGEMMREQIAVVLAVGPGQKALMTGTVMEMDLARGDYVTLCTSDQLPDGSMQVSDPLQDKLLLLAVDERAIVAKIEASVIEELRAEAQKKLEESDPTKGGIIIGGE